jgi:tetrahydromethanopterin S-methyltransferase subunit B
MEYATFDQVKTLVEMQGNIANGKLDSIRQDVCRVEGKVDDLKAFVQTQGADLEICSAELEERVTVLEQPVQEKAARKKLIGSWKGAVIGLFGFALLILNIIIAVKVLF